MAKKKANPIGRPPKFSSAKELDEMVDKYVIDCREKDEPLAITGLALFIGFCDKCSLYEYQKKPEFTHSIKRARTIVEHGYEKRLQQGGGIVFALKNFGWTDAPQKNVDDENEVTSVVFKVEDASNREA